MVVRVSNEGAGVPAEMCERVFELYAQGDRPYAGARGVVLAFCRLARVAHGGTIWVEPNRECGASFCIGLPDR